MDLIDRKAAIDAVNAYLGLSAVSRTIQNMTNIQEILKKLPSAQPEPQWIPCKDRLPDINVYVLTTTVWADITIGEKIGANDWFICEGELNADSDDIVAWMPLPEPYAERRTDERA